MKIVTMLMLAGVLSMSGAVARADTPVATKAATAKT